MVVVSKSGALILLLITAPSTLSAQSSAPGAPLERSGIVDARQVVLPSVLATQRSWRMRDQVPRMRKVSQRTNAVVANGPTGAKLIFLLSRNMTYD